MSINSTLNPLFYYCFDSRTAFFVFSAFAVIKILLCGPLSILVFHLGHQQWQQQQRSTRTTTHSDIFTYHMAAMELISLVAYFFYFSGTYTDFTMMGKVGLYVSTMSYAGEMWFHCLTCVERYLAVVHPIFYRSLRQSSGVKIRNISIGCVWIMGLVWVGIVVLCAPNFPIIQFFCFMVFSLLVVSFCSLSVLCVLIRPGPGDVGGDERRFDQSKQRACHAVMAILVVLWFWFAGILVCFALDRSPFLHYNEGCVVMMSGLWFTVPGSVVLPLLFLQRAGKLPCSLA